MSAGKRISAKKVRDLLDTRIVACEEAAASYEQRGQPESAATERCAMHELFYVRGKLFPDVSRGVEGE